MIKINLLTVDRDRILRHRKSHAVRRLVGACGLVVAAGSLLVGLWYSSIQRASATVDEDIVNAQRETIRLQNVIQQVRSFEARRAQLQQRVTLIEELRKAQTGPARLLDQISRSLPDSMWLTQLKQTGSDVAIDGRCMTLTALSDFVASLEVSKQFQGPVEIVDSQVETAVTGVPELIRFSVKGRLAGRN